tara:strand:- start:378 stop:803 length:426 start_codon:yes stop_codon:yes gene_type:complete
MPKPVLSDSLFNADDVATAVLAEANLQVANSELGVTDKSSIFSKDSSISETKLHAFAFNGFMFLQIYGNISGAPTNGMTLYTITDSDFYPNDVFYTHTIGYQTDTAEHIKINTDGSIKVFNATNPGQSYWYLNIDTFYRFS